MAKENEAFLARWSRLKREGGEPEQVPAGPAASDAAQPGGGNAAEAPMPELPPIDQLTPESDFRPFMDPRVPEALRRVALKKLYADPHFNVQDMLDDFAEDYNTLLETLPAGMADRLAHARRTLLGRDEADRIEVEEREAAAKSAAGGASQPREGPIDTAAPPPQTAQVAEAPTEEPQPQQPGAPKEDIG
jgi:Protein of unknown function (DUF3306)